MSHTPGPWEVDFRNCHAGQVAVCHGDGEGYFEVWSRAWTKKGIDQRANAHLIAAAPDMLAALKNLVAAIEALRGLHIVVPELAEAKRAIAQAGTNVPPTENPHEQRAETCTGCSAKREGEP